MLPSEEIIKETSVESKDIRDKGKGKVSETETVIEKEVEQRVFHNKARTTEITRKIKTTMRLKN